MGSRAKVSIITPTFDRAAYLCAAIDSVLSQTFGDFELIVVDDGSTDDTRAVVERYQADDSRIRYFWQSNQGQSVARNRGIEEAEGEFICFLDSDNAWRPHKLERSLREFDEHPEADIVYGDFIVIDCAGKEIGTNRMKRYSGFVTPQLLKDNFVSMNTTMTRRACFAEMGGFDGNDRFAEDYGLWLRFSTRYHFRYIAEVLGYYRVMENQISSDKQQRFRANERLLLQFIERFPEVLTQGQKRRGLSYFYVRKARYEIFQGESRRALMDIGRSLKQDPLWRGPWKALARMVVGRRSGRPG